MANQIEVSKIFNAPVSMVWQLWVDPELVKRWWGPKYFTAPVAIIDFREGGRAIVSMQAPKEMGGQVYYSLWEYVTILPMKTIEFIQNLSDPVGNKIDPVSAGMPADFPQNIRTVVTFTELSPGQTQMNVTEYAVFGSISNFAQLGLEQSMEKMLAIFGTK